MPNSRLQAGRWLLVGYLPVHLFFGTIVLSSHSSWMRARQSENGECNIPLDE
jgi:hypothetical protein